MAQCKITGCVGLFSNLRRGYCSSHYYRFLKYGDPLFRLRMSQTNRGRNPLLSTYIGMKQRCLDKKHPSYKNYGGRGIKICKEWLSVEGFENFYSDMGKKEKGMTLDRIDNNKGYSKENCRWATYSEQKRNQRNNVIFNGEYQTDASKRLGGSSSLIFDRLRTGWTLEKAFTEPLKKEYRRNHPLKSD